MQSEVFGTINYISLCIYIYVYMYRVASYDPMRVYVMLGETADARRLLGIFVVSSIFVTIYGMHIIMLGSIV